MKYNKQTKEIKDVCITDANSIPAQATNCYELIPQIKTQLEELALKGRNVGVLGFNDTFNLSLDKIGFTYDNVRINKDDKLLYVDLKLLNTPAGRSIQEIINDDIVLKYARCVLTGKGTVNKDKSISDYEVISVNFNVGTSFAQMEFKNEESPD